MTHVSFWNSVKSALILASAVVEQSADVCGDFRTSFSLLMSQSPRPGPVTLLQSAGKSWPVQLFLFFFFLQERVAFTNERAETCFKCSSYTPRNYEVLIRHIRLKTVKYVHVKLQQQINMFNSLQFIPADQQSGQSSQTHPVQTQRTSFFDLLILKFPKTPDTRGWTNLRTPKPAHPHPRTGTIK